MILENYHQFGSTERNSGAIRNILEYQEIVAPHTGEPFTEAMLMGIGGGLGAEYATWAFKGLNPKEPRKARLYLRFHHVKNYVEKKEDTILQKIASRIGAKLTTHETANREKGYERLISSLENGFPVITHLSVWESLRLQREVVERYNQEKDFFGPPLYDEFVHFLPYYTMPYGWFQSHVVVVYGIDENTDKVYLSDWSKQPLTITLKELAESRGVVRRIKNTTLIMEPPTKAIDLVKAVREGIRDCHQGLLYGYTRMIRVDAWEMMANRIANKKDKQGWPQLFNEPELLFDALTRLHAQISFFNSSGGALRSAYADFLDEASEIIGKPKLKEVSTLFRDVASKWDDLAIAVLPNSISLFKEARIEALKWNNLFTRKGQSAQKQLEITAEKIKSIRHQVIDSFPLNENEVLEFLSSLSQSLFSIYKCEHEALEALKSVFP